MSVTEEGLGQVSISIGPLVEMRVSMEINSQIPVQITDHPIRALVGVKQFLKGDQGPAGTSVSSTDNVPEGASNLYYTEQRANAAIAIALDLAAAPGDGANLEYDVLTRQLTAINTDKGSVAVATHAIAADPHPQYLDNDDILDGGNF